MTPPSPSPNPSPALVMWLRWPVKPVWPLRIPSGVRAVRGTGPQIIIQLERGRLMHGPWHMPEHPDEQDVSAQEDADMTSFLEAHIDRDLPVPPDPGRPYRIYMEQVRTGDGGFSPYATLDGGWYGPVAGVGMNHEVYCRVPEDRASWFSRADALHFAQRAKYPCRCVPPIAVTY